MPSLFCIGELVKLEVLSFVQQHMYSKQIWKLKLQYIKDMIQNVLCEYFF
jgi:hypothetical protein